MEATTNIRPVIHIKGSCDDIKAVLRVLSLLVKDANLDLNISVDLNNDEQAFDINAQIREHINELDSIMADQYVPSIVTVDDDSYPGDALISLTGLLDSSFSIRDRFACLDNTYSADIYGDLHQEPFAGKKEELGKFSIKHNRKALQKDARYINKQNRCRRFPGKMTN